MVALVGLILFVTFPAWVRPGRITAWARGEADNHLWMHWQWANGDVVWSNVPEGTSLPLMDLVHLPFFALGFSASAAIAWNLVWIGSVAVAALGGAWLGHEATRTESGAVIGAAVLASSPFLGGMGSFGITEMWPLGWLAVAAAGLLRLGRDRRVRWAVVVVGALVICAHGGWYLAFAAAISMPFFALFVARSEGRGGLVRWGIWCGGITLCAVALSLPWFLAFLEQRELWAHRASQAVTAPEPMWWLGPSGGGADFLQFLTPVPLDTPRGVSVYLGVLTSFLAVLGALRSRRWGLLAGALLVLVLALGPTLVVAGRRTGLLLPVAGLLGLVPDLQALSHWYRLTSALVVLLVPLAALGALQVARARQWLPWALAVGIVVDGRLLSVVPWPAEQYVLEAPAGLSSESEGALLLLPFDNGREAFDGLEPPRLYDRWGVALQRRLSENYDGPDVLLRTNRLVAALDFECGPTPTIPRAWRPGPAFSNPETLDQVAATAGLRRLIREGYSEVAVIRSRVVDEEACRAQVVRWLGEPVRTDSEVLVWRIPEA